MKLADTARLRLPALSEADEALYVALYTDAGTMRWVAPPLSAARARGDFLAALAAARATPPTRRCWVLRRREDDTALGLIGLVGGADGRGEVGVLLPPAAQDRGYASEAIAALADAAFAAGLASLHTRHLSAHGLAAGLMRRLGFRPQPPAPDGGCRWRLQAADWRRAGGGQGPA